MADEKTETKTAQSEEKTKQTVPGLIRTARGVAQHAAAVLDMQWDKERKVFRDPFTVMMALFTYAKLTPTLLAEAEERLIVLFQGLSQDSQGLSQGLDKKQTAFETRLAAFETRLTTVERWRDEVVAQNIEMVKDMEEAMANGKLPAAIVESLQNIKTLVPPALVEPSNGEKPAIIDATATVTPLKLPATKNDKPAVAVPPAGKTAS